MINLMNLRILKIRMIFCFGLIVCFKSLALIKSCFLFGLIHLLMFSNCDKSMSRCTNET